MTEEERAQAVRDAEAWFERHGLPYFVHGNAGRVRGRLAWRRLIPIVTVAVLLALVASVAVGWRLSDVSAALTTGSVVLGVMLVGYALLALQVGWILRWAFGQTVSSLGWLFPLITRALPLLLLFVTLMFINTEVWEVATSLSRDLLWLTVLLFASVAVAFLLVRLPEEVGRATREASGDRLVSICAGTPMAELAGEVMDDAGDRELTALQRANLVLVLLFSQGLQVLLLSGSVFLFFVVFGNVAIGDSVIESWLGAGHPQPLPRLDWLPVSNELFQVSVFLAAFSGLYFTVYAVTDQIYRDQFFTSISRDLERAIGVQTVYRLITRSL